MGLWRFSNKTSLDLTFSSMIANANVCSIRAFSSLNSTTFIYLYIHIYYQWICTCIMVYNTTNNSSFVSSCTFSSSMFYIIFSLLFYNFFSFLLLQFSLCLSIRSFTTCRHFFFTHLKSSLHSFHPEKPKT